MVSEHYLSVAFIITIVILLYTLYYGIVYTRVSDWIYRIFAKRVNKSVFHTIFFRLSGFFLFGLGPAFIFKLIYAAEFDFLSLQINHIYELLPWVIVLFFIAIIIPYMNVKNSKQSLYPQFKITNWTNSYKMLSYITWILYLAGYEFMFRGVLLFGTVEEIGYFPAILLNVSLYAFVHIPKGIKEVVGCFILGPILCVLALEMHNIIIPTILHITVCLSNEYFAIRAEVLKRINV